MEKKIERTRLSSQADTINKVAAAFYTVSVLILFILRDSKNEGAQLVIYYMSKFFPEFLIIFLIIIFRKRIKKTVLSLNLKLRSRCKKIIKKPLISKISYYSFLLLIAVITIFLFHYHISRKSSNPTLFHKAINAEIKGLYRKSLAYYEKQIRLFPNHPISDKALSNIIKVQKKISESKILLSDYIIKIKVGPLTEEKVYLLIRAINLDPENILALEQAEMIVLQEQEIRALLSTGIQAIKDKNWQGASRTFKKINSKYENYGHSREIVEEINEFMTFTNKAYYLEEKMDRESMKNLHNRNIFLVPYCFYTKQIEKCINELTKDHQIIHLKTLVKTK